MDTFGRRRFLVLPLALASGVIGGCGFRLRGETILPAKSVFLAGPSGSPVLSDLRRILTSSDKNRIADKREDAEMTLDISGDAREKVILSLARDGRVREFQLRHRVVFRILREGQSPAQQEEIVISRIVSHNDAEVLAKDNETELIYREMKDDAVQQLLRRLAAAKA